MKKKMVCVILAGAMAMTSLTGCSALLPGKVTAESLVTNAFGNEPEDGKRALDIDLKVGLNMEMDMSGMGMEGSMDMAIDMEANMKSNGKYGHMEGGAEISMFGMKMPQNLETYYDYGEGVQYDYDSESGIWTFSDMEDGTDVTGIVDGFADGLFDELELKDHRRGEEYVVSGTLSYDDLEDFAGAGFTGDLAEIDDALEDMEFAIEMKFDEKTKLIKSLDMDVDVSGSVEGVEINEFDISVTFNQIGGDVDVKIPMDVKKKAVDASDAGTAGTDTGAVSEIPADTGPQTGGTAQEGISPAPGIVHKDIETADPGKDEGQETPAPDQAGQADSGSLGAFGQSSFYGGFPISAFVNDGWEMEKDFDGIFVPASNSKYDGADLCLYGRKNPVTVDDLSSGGVWGYDIDIAYCGTSQLPAFSIGGITWGASADDVKSVFGTPGDEISTSFYSSVMTYELQDGTEVEFKVTENNEYGINGLVGVSVVNYGLIE